MRTAMTARHMPLLAALMLTTSAAGTANAQEAATDFRQLEARTRPGDTVYLTGTDGRRARWKLGDVPLQTLIREAGLSLPQVTEIAIERRDSPWNGALIGLAVAGTPWLITCAANDWCYYNEYGAENMLRTMALMSTAAGAGIGALIDLSIRKRITIYQGTRRRTLDIGVSPESSPSGPMLRLSARF